MTLEKLGVMLARSLDTMVTKTEMIVTKEEINGRFDSVDRRLDKIESKIESMTSLVDDHEKDILNLKHKVSVLGRKQA